MIYDEIKAGMGKIDKWFVFQHSVFQSDIINLTQGIVSDISMGTIITCEGLVFTRGDHGSKSTGKSIVCVVGSAVFYVLMVVAKSEWFCSVSFWTEFASVVFDDLIHCRRESSDDCGILARTWTIDQRCW
jgi:adenosylmethionine-8-amino-7-oxononanoate aminotransferase